MGRFFRRRRGDEDEPPAPPPAGPARLITAVLTWERKRWTVAWLARGLRPDALTGRELTDVSDRAAAAVAQLYAAYPPVPGAELQLTIYPWDFDDGPVFDIEGGPGAFVARD